MSLSACIMSKWWYDGKFFYKINEGKPVEENIILNAILVSVGNNPTSKSYIKQQLNKVLKYEILLCNTRTKANVYHTMYNACHCTFHPWTTWQVLVKFFGLFFLRRENKSVPGKGTVFSSSTHIIYGHYSLL